MNMKNCCLNVTTLRQRDPLTYFTPNTTMINETIEKEPSSQIAEDIARLCAEFYERVCGQFVQNPISQQTVKEDQASDDAHYTQWNDNPQVKTSDFWCEGCQKFISSEHVR